MRRWLLFTFYANIASTNYVIGPAGTGLCASLGMLPLNASQCQDAATKLSKTWLGSNGLNIDTGCKLTQGAVIFNNKPASDPAPGSHVGISSVCTLSHTNTSGSNASGAAGGLSTTVTNTTLLLNTTAPSSGSCTKDLITCRVDHSFDKYEYYVNGSNAKSVCRSPAGVRSRLGDNITFNISLCKPLVQETLTHRFTSVTLIPVLPWITFSRRIPGPVTCVCALALSKTHNGSLNDLSAQDEEEKRQFEVDGFVMHLTGPPDTTGKFIIDISSRLLPVVRIESCKISDGGLNELYLIKNFSLLLEADWNHMKQLRANISNLSQSLSSWQLQMRSFALPEQARIFFSCTVHHCAQQDPCPRTARRLITADLSNVTNHLRKRQLSDSPSVGLLKTSMVGDSNGVALEFLQTVGMNRPSSSSPTVIINGDSNGVVLNFSHRAEMSRQGRSAITTTMTNVSLSLTNQIESTTSTVYVDTVSFASSKFVAPILAALWWHSL